MMSAYFLVPLFLYRSSKHFMVKFYMCMTALVAARKLYRMMLFFQLCTFHFFYLCIRYNDVGIIISTIAFALFYSFTDVEKWLHRLHEERRPLCIAALSTVVFAFIPHLSTLAVTMSYVLLAAIFYPSRSILSLWENKDERNVLVQNKDMLIKYYY